MKEVAFDYWMFLAGLGIFLFGMYHLEDGVKGLAGKSFKNLIQRFTNKSWQGIITGTVVTGILQSSSMVTLLVLAFLGGGMITLRNSLGVVLGANLGTTFTAWIVATLGFKMDIADFSYPFLAIGIVSYLFLKSRPFLKNLGAFLVGFGLLFLGLDFMKVSVENIAGEIDLTFFASYGLGAFLLMGLVITGLIQSSSAMIVIILSALNAGLVDIYQSVAMVIGANIGTTATLVIGSLGGTADKKRLSMANVIFNLFAGFLVFFFIHELVYGAYYIFRVEDPLMELVLLNTLLNLIGIVLIYPFLGLFERFLRHRFLQAEPAGETLYIKNISPDVPDVALKALDKELKQVYLYTREFILDCLKIGPMTNHKDSGWKMIFRRATGLNERYDKIKRLEDELTSYYAQLQEQNLNITEAEQLTASMMGLRSIVYGAKDMKDVMHNIQFMMENEDPLGIEILKRLQEFVRLRLGEINSYLEEENQPEVIPDWLQQNEIFYNETINYLYKNIKSRNKEGVPISTITNVVKQTVSSMDNLCSSIIYWKLKKGTILNGHEPGE
ncbi:MAG: Na/Pi cotransporter family protein [Flavobacteriaceae bacterium]|nr:Na/Pi cotransporter family protein [Flavobacteriaceae bacterium]